MSPSLFCDFKAVDALRITLEPRAELYANENLSIWFPIRLVRHSKGYSICTNQGSMSLLKLGVTFYNIVNEWEFPYLQSANNDHKFSENLFDRLAISDILPSIVQMCELLFTSTFGYWSIILYYLCLLCPRQDILRLDRSVIFWSQDQLMATMVQKEFQDTSNRHQCSSKKIGTCCEHLDMSKIHED